MATLMGQTYRALVAQALPCCYFVGVSLSSYRREPFLRSASLGQGVVLDRRVSSHSQNVFILYLPLKTLKSNLKLQIL
jgi:hypothetical protein